LKSSSTCVFNKNFRFLVARTYLTLTRQMCINTIKIIVTLQTRNRTATFILHVGLHIVI